MWNGYRYWMAFTPYPSSNDDYENPSIVASSDGSTWVVPAGLTNPIVPFPGGASFNADAEIVLGQDNILYLFYMDSNGSSQNRALVRSSSDGITWSGETQLFTTAYKGFGSPSVVWGGSQYVMWYVDGTVSPYKLYKRTCSIPSGTWSSAAECSITIPAGWYKDIWHLDVILHNGVFYCVMNLCAKGSTGSNGILWIYRSADGVSFSPDATPLLLPSASGWDNSWIYRSSGLISDKLYIYYSAKSEAGAWGTGKTECAL